MSFLDSVTEQFKRGFVGGGSGRTLDVVDHVHTWAPGPVTEAHTDRPETGDTWFWSASVVLLVCQCGATQKVRP